MLGIQLLIIGSRFLPMTCHLGLMVSKRNLILQLTFSFKHEIVTTNFYNEQIENAQSECSSLKHSKWQLIAYIECPNPIGTDNACDILRDCRSDSKINNIRINKGNKTTLFLYFWREVKITYSAYHVINKQNYVIR